MRVAQCGFRRSLRLFSFKNYSCNILKTSPRTTPCVGSHARSCNTGFYERANGSVERAIRLYILHKIGANKGPQQQDLRRRISVKIAAVINGRAEKNEEGGTTFKGRERRIADIPVDHPSCSKQHAVLQYRQVSYERANGSTGRAIRPYIIDLESSNGTFLNNKKIDPQRYVELKEKDVLKFGFSSREYVMLHENSQDEEFGGGGDSGDASPSGDEGEEKKMGSGTKPSDDDKVKTEPSAQGEQQPSDGKTGGGAIKSKQEAETDDDDSDSD